MSTENPVQLKDLLRQVALALQIKLMLFFETDLHLAGGFYAGEETAKTLATVIVIQWYSDTW